MSKRTPVLLFGLFIVAPILALTAAGCDPATGSCAGSWTRADGSKGQICSELGAGSTAGADDLKALCTAGGGTYSASDCATADVLGHCDNAPLTGTVTAVLVDYYYVADGVPEAEVKQHCEGNGGTYTAGL
ncbi:MAG: hypothetical protein U0414_21660 [Polyangiaceae bacterium]